MKTVIVLITVIEFIEFNQSKTQSKLENHLDICDSPMPCSECIYLVDRLTAYKSELNSLLGIKDS